MSKRSKSAPTLAKRPDGSLYSSERVHDKFKPQGEDCRDWCTDPTSQAADLHKRQQAGKGRTRNRDNGPRKR